LELLAFLDKLSPILIVIIPSYFSFKSTQNTKETDKQISLLSDKISAIEKTVSNVEAIGKDNSKGLNVIGKGLQRLQRFRLQENLKKAIRRGNTNQHEIEELSRLYESYVELGGNGAIKVLYEKFLALEIVEENINATDQFYLSIALYVPTASNIPCSHICVPCLHYTAITNYMREETRVSRTAHMIISLILSS